LAFKGGRGQWTKKNVTEVSKYFFWRLRKFFRALFLSRFFFTPLVTKRPKNAIKKSCKTTEGDRKKTEGGGGAFFVMSPDGFFGQRFYRVFYSPCHGKQNKKMK
jgi:hypothetical protein